MKFILVCLSFYLTFDFISALDPFNIQQQHHEYDILDTDHRDPPLQEFEYDEYADSQLNAASNESNRVNQQNRSQSWKNKYQPDDDLENTNIARDPVNPPIHNQEVNPKFRPWFQTHRKSTILSILKDNMPLIELHETDGKSIAKTTKSSSLLQILTPKPEIQGRMSFGDYYFRQQLQAFFKRQHDKFPAATRSFIKNGLR